VSKLLYDAFISLYPLAVKIASPFNAKASLWKNGRKGIFEKMQDAIDHSSETIWFHCSSLGEFEQGRPVIEKLKALYPSHKILLTFFSPSGYEVRKNYDQANYVFYLPIDSEKNAVKFFDIVQPVLAVFVKYEFWHYYLHEAKNRNVSLLLISAIFLKHQTFFSKKGHFYRQMLACFTRLFVQNQESVDLLKTIGFTENVSLAGDTRFDRVVEIAEQFKPIEIIESFIKNPDTIVAGSTWSEDDKRLSEYANHKENVSFIIAPHDITKDRISECLKIYKQSILFSSLAQGTLPKGKNTIIIDNIGMLSRLYKYGTITYVGGGFGKDGVHNVLEAAVYGKPVVFGPEYKKYVEAIELVATTGATSIKDTSELEIVFDKMLQKDAKYYEKSKASLNYVYSKRGSTEKILQFIHENRLLTN
jgi:3-deoxy-D-manno-octulosonic-acid transferase